jgi:hypothetical protein
MNRPFGAQPSDVQDRAATVARNPPDLRDGRIAPEVF